MGRPVRVLYLRDTSFVCGPGKTILNTFRTIDRARIALTLAVPTIGNSPNAFIDRARSIGLPVADLPVTGPLGVGTIRTLADVIRNGQFDLVQSHDFQTRRIAGIAARMAGVPHLTSVHGWIANSPKQKVARRLDQFFISTARRVIVVSKKLQRDVIGSGTPAERVLLLQNGVLLDDYPDPGPSSAARAALGLPASAQIMGIVGRLSPEKRHDLFLEAARSLVATEPNLHFVVAGHGALQGELEQRATALGIGSHVSFLGHRTDMHVVYAALDVLMLCSDTEGLPNVVLEAFAYGRPVVATSVGGVPDVITDGHDGFIVPPGQLEPLVDRVRRLVRDRDAATLMGRHGRQTIEKGFDFRWRTAALETLYESQVSSFPQASPL